MTCETCQKELEVGDWPWCPHGHGTNVVIGDDIPGGVEIRHGLVNADGSPMKFYSKSAITAEAKRRGLSNHVEHVTDGSSDKNKWTSRWV